MKPVNKDNAIYDIILTFSLIISIIITGTIIEFTELQNQKHCFLIFSVILFVLIKIIYNLTSKAYRSYKKRIRK